MFHVCLFKHCRSENDVKVDQPFLCDMLQLETCRLRGFLAIFVLTTVYYAIQCHSLTAFFVKYNIAVHIFMCSKYFALVYERIIICGSVL